MSGSVRTVVLRLKKLMGDVCLAPTRIASQGARCRQRRSWVAALLLVLLLSSTQVALAQVESVAFSTASSNWEGYSEFTRLSQREIGSKRIKPTAVLDYGKLRANDAVIIIRPLSRLDERSLSAFLADGGRVAILDDFGKSASFLEKFGIQRVPAPNDPEQRVRNNSDFAIAVPSTQIVAGAERGRHPMTVDVQAVVTNHAMVLRHPNLTPVLELRTQSGSSRALAVTGVIAKHGRLFALGDPSVFINLMMRYPGNRNLARGLIQYLSERNEPHTESSPLDPTNDSPTVPGNIWIAANNFEQIGRYGAEESLLEQWRRKLEELKKSAAKVGRDGMPPVAATALAAVLGLWLFQGQLKRNLRLFDSPSQSFARAPLLAAQTGLSARATVLSSKNAHPILALMELDAALRETLARRLQLNPSEASEQLAPALVSAGFSPSNASTLIGLLSQLRDLGQSLAHKKPRKISNQKLKNLHAESMRMLKEIEQASQ